MRPDAEYLAKTGNLQVDSKYSRRYYIYNHLPDVKQAHLRGRIPDIWLKPDVYKPALSTAEHVTMILTDRMSNKLCIRLSRLKTGYLALRKSKIDFKGARIEIMHRLLGHTVFKLPSLHFFKNIPCQNFRGDLVSSSHDYAYYYMSKKS